MLAAALEGARRGDRGGTLLIEGPAGVGKTALLGELVQRAEVQGYQVLQAHGSEMERDFGYGLVRQLFGPLLRSLDQQERAKLFAGPAGLAAAIFGLGGGALEVGAAESSLYGLFWMLAGLVERGPLVLAIDDAHWSDSASLRFVRYLGKRLDGLPVLVVLAARPNEPGVQAEQLRGLAADLEMPKLQPALLSEAGTATIVRERLGADASDQVEAACHEATGGNPFLIEELLTELAAADGVAGVPLADRIAAMGPERIAASVSQRAARLDPHGVDVVRAAAVLGDAADLRTLAALVGVDHSRISAIVDGLTAASILVHGSGHDFAHPLLRAAVYEDVPTARRAESHARAAETLAARDADAEQVAAHLLLCPPRSAVNALEALDAAARSAADRGAPDSAATYLRRALEEVSDPTLRGALLHRIGGAEFMLGDPASIAHLAEAVELTRDPSKALETSLAMIDALFLTGQWDAAVAALDSAFLRFGQSELPGLAELEAHRTAGRGYDPAKAPEYERALPQLLAAIGERHDDESSRLRWAVAALEALRGAPREEVLALLAPISEDWVRGPSGRESSFVAHAIVALLMVEALDEGDRVAAALLEGARRRGSATAVVTGLGFAAAFDQRRGRLAASEESLTLGLEVLQENEFSPMALATSLNFSIETILERRGLTDVAELGAGIELPPALAETFWGGMAFEVRAAVRLMRGERQAAIEDLRAAERIFRPLRVGPRFSPWRSRLALALADESRDEALQLAKEEHELARTESPRAESVALRALGVLTGGDAGIDLLRESAAKARPCPSPLESARSLAELGAALRRRNQRAEAREHLREAAELAQRCGAERLEEKVHEELRIAGARPRRRALSGADSLTPGERRVADAAAGGATNREIAQDLFVSLRTVEMHLTNAYRKLDISSRSELSVAIGGTPETAAGL